MCSTITKHLTKEKIQSTIDSMMVWLKEPCNAMNIGVFRIMFGIMMICDVFHERGLTSAEQRWGDSKECKFPLFDWLPTLPLKWMVALYSVILLAAIFITVGLFYRAACLVFCVTYWYIFLLDKTVWNNHSYLYGLLGVLMLSTNTNAALSLDTIFFSNTPSCTPFWTYVLFRFQIGLVYLYAGVKKLNADWVEGYSVLRLSSHWVFDPIKWMLPEDYVDLVFVHHGGLLLDLLAAFGLSWSQTRWLAVFFTTTFHVLNAHIFSIGMFPYVMMCSTTLFFPCDWPVVVARRLRACCTVLISGGIPPPQSDSQSGVRAKVNRGTAGKDRVLVVSLALYMMTQLFLPFSHFVTQGYNNWTNGLYGYSWDMMVHSWNLQHVHLWYTNTTTGEKRHLNPEYFTKRSRWQSHGDMVKQLAVCVRRRLSDERNIQDVSLHLDVWMSVNHRLQQRMFDPRVDLSAAPWHPLRPVPWLMPLQWSQTVWRDAVLSLAKDAPPHHDVIGVTDFPGLCLDNYVPPDVHCTIQVLSGEVTLHSSNSSPISKKRRLVRGETVETERGDFHTVCTTSPSPSVFIYTYFNQSAADLARELDHFKLYKQGRAAMNASSERRSYLNEVIKEQDDDGSSGARSWWSRKREDLRKTLRLLVSSWEAVLSGRDVKLVD